nr:hypothetical protein [Pandoravirus massiliensis]
MLSAYAEAGAVLNVSTGFAATVLRHFLFGQLSRDWVAPSPLFSKKNLFLSLVCARLFFSLPVWVTFFVSAAPALASFCIAARTNRKKRHQKRRISRPQVCAQVAAGPAFASIKRLHSTMWPLCFLIGQKWINRDVVDGGGD